jgi:hypothetical protein
MGFSQIPASTFTSSDDEQIFIICASLSSPVKKDNIHFPPL